MMPRPNYKSVSVDEIDYKEYGNVQKLWSKQFGARISMSQVIKIAMRDLKKQLERAAEEE